MKTKFIIAFSGGKDSIAMVLFLLEQGVQKSDIELHHHEVDGRGEPLFDWACTTSYCQAFADAFEIPIYFSYRNGGIVREMFRTDETVQDVYFQLAPNSEMTCLPAKQEIRFLNTRRMFPAISANLQVRWCSSTVKISILNQVITHTPRLNEKGTTYIVCTGERRAESTARSKYAEIEYHTTHTKKREVWHWRPVINFSDAEVWALLKKHKVQPHPSYMLGWGRCSCQLCIFGNANVWATLWEIDRPKVERIAQIEEELQHTLHMKNKASFPIMEVLSKGKSFFNPKNQYWKEQALGVFTAPIIINQWEVWQAPQGMNATDISGSN
jgi:3'-phosphoadenosine 5'-phosphosulfate sulfotransferase (PAPS reductase)/FAD synthetase